MSIRPFKCKGFYSLFTWCNFEKSRDCGGLQKIKKVEREDFPSGLTVYANEI